MLWSRLRTQSVRNSKIILRSRLRSWTLIWTVFTRVCWQTRRSRGLRSRCTGTRSIPTLRPLPTLTIWNYVDDAFAQAASAKKTIQLIVSAGFNSPSWVLDQIPSCDGLFQDARSNSSEHLRNGDLQGYQEGGDSTVLPLPWNPVYKSAWQTFLTALAARYGSNPAFVSIAVAGPTAASAEMIVPSDGNSTNPQTQFPERHLAERHVASTAGVPISQHGGVPELGSGVHR